MPAVAGLCIGLMSVALFVYATVASFLHGGQAEGFIGCVGIAAFLVACAGFALSVREVCREEVYKRVPVASLLVSVLSLGGWAAVYVLGWVV